jgi:hypothetical protein
MATLTNLKIKDTYDGLLKTSDNLPIDGTLKTLQDGLGNDLPLQVSTTEINFTGTVSGITAGGLGAGTGVDSMESKLTTVPADARGLNDIVIGKSAQSSVDASNGSNVVIGTGATQTGGEQTIVVGYLATASKAGISIGSNTDNNSGQGIAIGNGAETGSLDESCAIGFDASSTGNAGSLAVGRNSNATGINPSAFGRNASSSNNALAAGYNAVASGNESISLGANTDATASESTALGYAAQATAAGAVAIGNNVTAATANTASVKALETQTDSTPTAGGIIMSDAGGTDRRINIDAAGSLQIDSTPVGGGGGAAQSFSAIGASAMKGVVPYSENTSQQFKTNQMLSGYGTAQAGQNNDAASWQLIPVAEGNTISKLLVSVFAGLAGGTAQVAFYDTDVDSDGFLYVKDQLLNLGTVDCSTTGDKIITLGTPFTMPTGKVNGQIAVLVFRSDNAIGMRGWSQSVFSGWGGGMQSSTYYRAMAPTVTPGVAPGVALPATIGDKSQTGITYAAQTSSPLQVLWI